MIFFFWLNWQSLKTLYRRLLYWGWTRLLILLIVTTRYEEMFHGHHRVNIFSLGLVILGYIGLFFLQCVCVCVHVLSTLSLKCVHSGAFIYPLENWCFRCANLCSSPRGSEQSDKTVEQLMGVIYFMMQVECTTLPDTIISIAKWADQTNNKESKKQLLKIVCSNFHDWCHHL